MNQLLLFLFAFLLSIGTPKNKEVVPDKPIATCYGNTPCLACTNCRYCAHCHSGGGTCGVCSNTQGKTVGRQSSIDASSATTGQCQAITKKGTRCSRKGTYNGYCWQHRK